MNIKSEKGITLMTCVITVIIMFLIVGMIVYSSSSSMQVRDINNLHNDIRAVQEKVDLFYLKYGVLPYKLDYDGVTPLKYEYKDLSAAEGNITNTEVSNVTNTNTNSVSDLRSQEGINGYIGVIVENYPYRNKNDNNVYYEIDLRNFDNLTLTNYSQSDSEKYVYVVNEASHSVYLVSGIRVNKEYHYSPDYSNIPKLEDI